MEMKITIDDESISKLADAIASRLGGKPKPPPKAKREDLITMINAKMKGVDAKTGTQNKDIIIAIMKENGAKRVPDLTDNKIGLVMRQIEERTNG